MFLNDVNKKEEIRNLAIQDLKNFGIKYRPKKQRPHVQETKTRKIFKTSLPLLPMETVTLVSGQQLIIPKVVHEMCSFILTKVDTEGLFRKGGSKSRQNEIRLSLDAGCCLADDYHEIDIASVLKTFFRELPEPLFPYSYHELFLRCIILPNNNLKAVLLACLLLPCEQLNTLAYFMQFLHQVTDYSLLNKMDAYNLAVVIGPTLLPVEEKLAPHATHRLTKICELFKLLVENANAIGVVPENIIERIALSCSTASLTDEDFLNMKKKKKRRSGSLTRMFNGLKKIVSSKSVDETPTTAVVTPDLLMTPSMTRSVKKRKIEGSGFSLKKKREILSKLPQNSALSTPYTPVNINPNPKKEISLETCQKSTIKADMINEKKSQWSLRSRVKNNKVDYETSSIASKTSSSGTKAILERRWSQVSQVAGFRKNKKRNSCVASLAHKKNAPQDIKPSTNEENNDDVQHKSKHDLEPEYVRIPKTEYEEIKNRVIAIERRISLELEGAESEASKNLNTIENVQNAYEQTLVQTVPLSPTTDQLARRLSKELKIRRSSEQKIIRSPSARKIGSLRRRSRELEKQNIKLNRNQSWHVSSACVMPRTTLKRGKPNTIQTGLQQPTPIKLNHDTEMEVDVNNTSNPLEILQGVTPTDVKRITRSSVRGNGAPSSLHKHTQFSNDTPLTNNSDNWKSADSFFRSISTPGTRSKENSRASLAKLRSQNAGMVLAKAKLFDNLVDFDGTKHKETSSSVPRIRTTKMGSLHNPDRQSYRIRSLKVDDRRVSKKSMSPRRLKCKSPNSICQQRLQLAKSNHITTMIQEGSLNKLNMSPLRDYNHIDVPDLLTKKVLSKCTTLKNVPHIKKTFNVKSPKRLSRAPLGLESKSTPLKVMAAPRHNS